MFTAFCWLFVACLRVEFGREVPTHLLGIAQSAFQEGCFHESAQASQAAIAWYAARQVPE